MFGRYNRLIFIALVAIIVGIIGACTQPDDIVAPAASSQLTLTPARLPSLPTGMVYKLWLTKTDVAPRSLGAFSWDNEAYRFLPDSAANRIGSTWTLDFDALQYNKICLTIETDSSALTDSMGPIIVSDSLGAYATRPLKMKFPLDLWMGQAGFCVVKPTDGNTRNLPSSGVWFAYYIAESLKFVDTTDIKMKGSWPKTQRPLHIDTTRDSAGTIISIDTTNLDTLRQTLDTVGLTNIKRDTNDNYVIYLDTLRHIRCTYEFVARPVNVTSQPRYDTVTIINKLGVQVDTVYYIPPFSDYNHSLTYTVVNNIDTLDHFLPNYQDLPNLYDTKWHYKGWVISPYLTPVTSFAQLTKPTWQSGTLDYFIDPSDGGMVTTGSFWSFNAADEGNPHSMNRRVPPYPGEDFLVNLPAGIGPRGIYFADSANANPDYQAGTVFITLEPDNYSDSTTNFPLILMSSEKPMPSWRTVARIIPRYMDQRLTNWFRNVDNDPTGFPTVQVTLVRE
jgi:hypothetical protein